MKPESYEWLWQNIIKESILQIYFSINDGLRDCSDNVYFKLVYDSDVNGNLESTKMSIKETYEQIRDDLKRKCYFTEDIHLHKIDQHKIAACLCKTLVSNKVFCFSTNDETPDSVLMSNYSLAYAVSLQIIYLYTRDYYIKTGKREFLNKLILQKELLGPDTFHEEYHYGRIKALALNDYYGIEINLLSFADTLFWIDYYNRQLIEGTLTPGITRIE